MINSLEDQEIIRLQPVRKPIQNTLQPCAHCGGQVVASYGELRCLQCDRAPAPARPTNDCPAWLGNGIDIEMADDVLMADDTPFDDKWVLDKLRRDLTSQVPPPPGAMPGISPGSISGQYSFSITGSIQVGPEKSCTLYRPTYCSANMKSWDKEDQEKNHRRCENCSNRDVPGELR